MRIDLNPATGIGILVLALLAGLASGNEPLTTFEGHGMKFEYPTNWTVQDGLTGVIVGDLKSFVLSITMHDEGCYPLSNHPYLMDFMLKLWADPEKNDFLVGTPKDVPLNQSFENMIGPYSIGTQIYENPPQMVICELQGYRENNVTITYATTFYDLGPAMKEANLELGRLKMSLVITKNQTAPLVQCNDTLMSLFFGL